MFRRYLMALLLSTALGCSSQVVIVGGNATTAAPGLMPMAGQSPLVSTPDIALPGSGNAVGAPLSTAAANDSRTSTGPSVYNPNGPVFISTQSYSTAAAEATTMEFPRISEGTSASTLPFENGIQHFESGLSVSEQPIQSLGQIARFYRSRHEQPLRTFNNNSIARMNARGVRIGEHPSLIPTLAESTDSSIHQPRLVAANLLRQLPQSDRDDSLTESRSATARTAPEAENIDRVAMKTESSSQPAATIPNHTPTLEQPKPNIRDGAEPIVPMKSSSSLPVVVLFAALGVAGVLYWLKR